MEAGDQGSQQGTSESREPEVQQGHAGGAILPPFFESLLG